MWESISVGRTEMPVNQGRTQLTLILEVGNKGQTTLGQRAHRLCTEVTARYENAKGGGVERKRKKKETGYPKTKRKGD